MGKWNDENRKIPSKVFKLWRVIICKVNPPVPHLGKMMNPVYTRWVLHLNASDFPLKK